MAARSLARRSGRPAPPRSHPRATRSTASRLASRSLSSQSGRVCTDHPRGKAAHVRAMGRNAPDRRHSVAPAVPPAPHQRTNNDVDRTTIAVSNNRNLIPEVGDGLDGLYSSTPPGGERRRFRATPSPRTQGQAGDAAHTATPAAAATARRVYVAAQQSAKRCADQRG